MAIYKNGNNKEQFSTENTQGYHRRNVDFLKLIKAIQKKRVNIFCLLEVRDNFQVLNYEDINILWHLEK